MPTLAAITLHPTGGGVAVVAGLLWRVVRQRHPNARLLTMFSHENRPATLLEKASFGAALTCAQVLGTEWVLFSHLGPAQVQSALPSPVRKPYGVFLHGIEAWNPLSSAELRTLAQASVRIANSRYTAARVMAAHPEVGAVEACPLTLPPERHAGVGSADSGTMPGIGPHAVLMVGRMSASERYKGHDQMIEAWPRVVAHVPDAQLVIVGDGDDTARLRQKAAVSGASGQVLFTGFVGDAALHALYRQSALFALPSRGEGFGLVYLEAMAHGLPCIGSVHDAAADVIADFETGRLVDQGDPDGMARVVSELLVDEPQRSRMGHAGQARLLAEFSFDRFSERVGALLDRLEPRSARPA